MTRFARLALICMAFGVVLVSPTLARDLGEYRGTPEQQAACRPDVLKLCGPEIPNVERITQCLRYYNSNKKLTPECAAVFAEKRH
jgi:hypothetical protein